MLNSSEQKYISHLSNFLPDRKAGKRGPTPISKHVLVEQLFLKFRYGLPWRSIKHSSVCHSYLKELQRRGLFQKYFLQLTKPLQGQRLPKTIVDSSDMESHRTNGWVAYSGKYHNYCIKMSVEMTPEYVPVSWHLGKGTKSDSIVLDEMLAQKDKLPYEICLDKGYEKYERRRELRKKNCQVRMEMKKHDKSRKRGPRFKFTDKQRQQRGEIEKLFGWIKSFTSIRYNRLKLKSLITAKFIICLSYIAFSHL